MSIEDIESLVCAVVFTVKVGLLTVHPILYRVSKFSL